MTHRFIAEIRFSFGIQHAWPTKVFIAEAHLTSDDKSGPWSMRAELWNPPDENGIAQAWISFLSPKAPIAEISLDEPFKLTLGNKVIATCRMLSAIPPHSTLHTGRHTAVQDKLARR